MTLFGKFLALVLFALVAGAGTLVMKNLESREMPPPPFQGGARPTERSFGRVPEQSEEERVVLAPTKTPVPIIPPPLLSPPLPVGTKVIAPPDWNSINTQTRGALVNILCTAKEGDIFRPLSGSGVFIDPRGIILTNAHVAQYLLLTGGDEKSNILDCVVRTGSPAANRYRAEILFISPQWIADNAAKLLEENAKERGENDYALLVVTSTTNPDARLPASFPFISLREAPLVPDTKDAFLVAGYPAGFLGGIAVQRELWSVSAFATIASRYTLSEDTLDMVGLGGNLLAQKGASGGAVVDTVGALAGLITTALVEGATDARDVRALTTDYINRAFTEEAGFPLFAFKTANLTSLTEQFNTVLAPQLRQKLVEVIYKTNGN